MARGGARYESPDGGLEGNDIVIRGNSWGAALTHLSSPSGGNVERMWFHLVRKALGLRDNWFTFAGDEYQVAGADFTQKVAGRGGFPVQMEGQIAHCSIWFRAAVGTGSASFYRTYRLYNDPDASDGWCFLITSQSTTLAASTRHQLAQVSPSTTYLNYRLVPYGPLMLVNNTTGGVEQTDNGNEWIVVINGGEYSNHAKNASMYCQTGHMNGGWGELDIWESLRIRNAGGLGSNAPLNAFDGFMDPTKAAARLPIYTHAQNDFGGGQTEDGFKETMRFMWSMDKAAYRYVGGTDGQLAFTNGNGGGTWATLNSGFPTGALNSMKWFTGAVGTSTPTKFTLTLPSDYRTGMPVAVYFMAHPGRTQTVTTTNNDATVTTSGTFYSTDDVGLRIAGTGIPAGATILSVTNSTTIELSANATATGSTTAVIGFGGYDCTIDVDGDDPATGDYLINGDTDDTFSTDQITPFHGYGGSGFIRTESGLGACRAFPLAKVLTGDGLQPGSVITVTLNSQVTHGGISAGAYHFYCNGYVLEAIDPSPPILMMNQPVLLATSASTYTRTMHGEDGRTNCAMFNEWLEELVDEHEAQGRGNIVIIDMHSLLNEAPELFADDGQHMSMKGHKLTAQLVLRLITKLKRKLRSA